MMEAIHLISLCICFVFQRYSRGGTRQQWLTDLLYYYSVAMAHSSSARRGNLGLRDMYWHPGQPDWPDRPLVYLHNHHAVTLTKSSSITITHTKKKKKLLSGKCGNFIFYIPSYHRDSTFSEFHFFPVSPASCFSSKIFLLPNVDECSHGHLLTFDLRIN